MAEKIIKARLFTWFEEVDSPVQPGTKVLAERIAHFGQKIDVTNDAYVERGEQYDAFYTDEEAKAIEDGTYQGFDRDRLFAARAGLRPTAPVEAIDDEHGDVASMDAAQLGEYIREHRLTVDKTVALAGDDEASINKVIDAENIATENEPRKGVLDRLEAKLHAGVAE